MQKVGRVPLLVSTIIRRMDDAAEDTEAQLLERINESLWCAVQVDESTDVDKTTVLVFVHIFFRKICTRTCDIHFCANQHHGCRTFQIFEQLHIRKTELVILS